jgi:hypothetical protein
MAATLGSQYYTYIMRTHVFGTPLGDLAAEMLQDTAALRTMTSEELIGYLYERCDTPAWAVAAEAWRDCFGEECPQIKGWIEECTTDDEEEKPLDAEQQEDWEEFKALMIRAEKRLTADKQ